MSYGNMSAVPWLDLEIDFKQQKKIQHFAVLKKKESAPPFHIVKKTKKSSIR